MNTRTWKLGGTIRKYEQCSCMGINCDDYWVDGTMDTNFESILKEIGAGKKVSITVQTCKVK